MLLSERLFAIFLPQKSNLSNFYVMSKITIRIDIDFSEGELKRITDNLLSKGEQNILNILNRHDSGDGMNKREIGQFAGHQMNAEDRAEILNQLIQKGLIEIIYQAANGHGSRYAIKKGRKRK